MPCQQRQVGYGAYQGGQLQDCGSKHAQCRGIKLWTTAQRLTSVPQL